jgi:3-methylcrotonyl-CoA carboxylase beta subunit
MIQLRVLKGGLSSLPRNVTKIKPRQIIGTAIWQNKRAIATQSYLHQGSAVSKLPTLVDASTAEFIENAQQMEEIVRSLESLHTKIGKGGSQKARDKHIARGKMLPREYVLKYILAPLQDS